jgi:protein O-GlcNAc transferase
MGMRAMPLSYLPERELGEDGGEQPMLSSPSARCLPLVFALLPLRAAQQQPPSLVELLEVLRQHPDNPGAHNNVGLALKAAGDLQGAVRHLETAIELNPEYARGYNSLGNALQASARSGGGMAQMERAAEMHLIATQLQPSMASAYNSLGNAQRALDNPEAAVRALSVAVELSGSGTHYSNLGAASLELHRLRVKQAAAGGGGAEATAEAAAALEATLRWLRVAEQLSPTDASAANNLAAALEADGQLGGARQVFDRLLEAEPENALLTVHRANVLKGQGLLHEAVHAYTRAIALGGGTEQLAYNNLGGSLQVRVTLTLALTETLTLPLPEP